jgi:mevalonyl-CoA ligase
MNSCLPRGSRRARLEQGELLTVIQTGGENIYPLEIEERLVAHPEVDRAIVVGLKDAHYGEIVAAFLERHSQKVVISDEDIRRWVRATLGRHKAPARVFWLGENGVPADVPLTGSGKVKKFEMAAVAERMLDRPRSLKL